MHKRTQSISKINAFVVAAVICLLFNSCASILLKKNTSITIKSDLDSVRFAILPDTTKWHVTPQNTIVKRSGKPIRIIAEKDTSRQAFIIKSKISNLVYLNLILPQSWMGVVIDASNNKCYDYPSTFYINMTDSAKAKAVLESKPKPPAKGSTNLKFAFPFINGLIADSNGTVIKRAGILGIGCGIDYYFNKKYCVQTTLGIASATILAQNQLGAVDQIIQQTTSRYSTFEIGTFYKNFQFSSGLQYMLTENSYRATYFNGGNRFVYSTSTYSNTFGLAFTGQYKFWNECTLDFRYYPSLFLWNEHATKFTYGHLVSLGGSIEFEVFRPKKSRSNYKL
jgi:hypothetical protein